MIKYEIGCGMTVNDAVVKMLEMANLANETVQGTHNDVLLTVKPKDNVNKILSFWSKEGNRLSILQDDKYRRKEISEILKKDHNKLIKELLGLNLKDDEAIINFICKFN